MKALTPLTHEEPEFDSEEVSADAADRDWLAQFRLRPVVVPTRNDVLQDVICQAERLIVDEWGQASPRYLCAESAVEGLRLAEQLRRLADVIAVDTLNLVTDSRVVHDHGHCSAKAAYGAVTHQSGRDLHGLEQVRKMLVRCQHLHGAAHSGRLSWDHLRLLGRVYANQRVRLAFVDQQRWILRKAKRFDFRRFEIIMNRWVNVNDPDGGDPNHGHQNRTATSVQDHFSGAWQRRATHGPLVGAAMREIEDAYIDAEFAKDWETAKATHGDDTCKDHLARTDAQRRADAVAQIYADAANNPNKSVGFNFVHNIVWDADTYFEMFRRHTGATARPFNLDTFRCETINGVQLETNEAFLDSITSPLRQVLIDAKRVVIDMSERRFFTGIARTALQLSHDECEWPGCHVPSTRCQGDHITPKARGGPTEQENGATTPHQNTNRHRNHPTLGLSCVTRRAIGSPLLRPGRWQVESRRDCRFGLG